MVTRCVNMFTLKLRGEHVNHTCWLVIDNISGYIGSRVAVLDTRYAELDN